MLESVVPYLRKARKAKFYNLMLHSIADEHESYKVADIPIGDGVKRPGCRTK